MKTSDWPWKIILDPDGKTYIEDANGKRVAEVYGALVDPNCFLIAAAPDLLQALQEFTKCGLNAGYNSELAKRAQIAILKAKGY